MNWNAWKRRQEAQEKEKGKKSFARECDDENRFLEKVSERTRQGGKKKDKKRKYVHTGVAVMNWKVDLLQQFFLKGKYGDKKKRSNRN